VYCLGRSKECEPRSTQNEKKNFFWKQQEDEEWNGQRSMEVADYQLYVCRNTRSFTAELQLELEGSLVQCQEG
jgi:hypothetical protein